MPPAAPSTLSLHDALPICSSRTFGVVTFGSELYGPSSTLMGVENAAREAGYYVDRKSTRLNSSHVATSNALFCLKKKSRWLARRAGRVVGNCMPVRTCDAS